MNSFKKLAIAGAVGTLMFGASAAQAHVSYNMSIKPSTTDPLAFNQANGNATNGTGTWTGGAATGYTGNLPATWIAFVHNDTSPNASYQVSTADALAEAGSITKPTGFAVESTNNKWNPANSWGNALDFGLIDLHSAGNLLIEVKADSSLGSSFTPGFTLFSGWDTSATSSKHGAWNVALPAVPVNPRGSAGLTYLGQASTTVAGGVASYLFPNLAAGHYSLWIGGNGTGNTTNNQTYIANITASPVPVPAAVWLFSSAIAGLVGFGRKKPSVSA